ncbi:hypothetical protein MF672_021235 [Actinomadura sp. ATCC 31491]|uniref:Sensor histidine kinase n=1 Tax=Actinomadura luzonensis TaxID=2805427 RepID=A0ABT0FVE9_9ACTN|nr:hypothetical protein [Actinomadura luzonensis]MCK2216306.1 hypothetical protein [Actinomadura luzonensis]
MNLATSLEESARERLAQQVALAGLAGAVLPLAYAGWTLLLFALGGDAAPPASPGVAEPGWWATLVLAWPLLHLLRVRPAWPVALAAPVFLLPVRVLVGDLVGVAILLAGVFAYPFAVLATARGVEWWRRGLVLGLYVALCAFLALMPGSAVSLRLA